MFSILHFYTFKKVNIKETILPDNVEGSASQIEYRYYYMQQVWYHKSNIAYNLKKQF